MKTNKKNVEKKRVEKKEFLYLVPEAVSVREFHQALDYLPEEAVEIWTEINVMEISVEERTITFESLYEELSDADRALLENLSMKQIYICEYQTEDSQLVKKVMKTLVERFQGKLGSDTEDFEPFLSLEQL